ncbi:uncharacterized protein LOC108607516 [Drosophila busckii]|nr:uncharacterized protein LOC108607516 [Drosophila busckii]
MKLRYLLSLSLLLLLLLWQVLQVGSQRNQLAKADPQFYTSPIVRYGKPTKLMLTITIMPDYPIALRLLTANYLIAYCEVGQKAQPTPPEFKQTDDMTQLLSEHRIKSNTYVKYNSGYYALVTAKFYHTGDKQLLLVGTVPSKPHIRRHKVFANFTVKPPKRCVPRLECIRSSHPDVPMLLIVSRSSVMRTYFTKRCNKTNIDPEVTWSIRELLDMTVYRTYVNATTIHTVKQYTMNFHSDYELWRDQYLMQVEGVYEGQIFLARCYVKVLMGDVQAYISGGRNRYVSSDAVIHLDGSKSRDYSKPKYPRSQFKAYYWDCAAWNDIYNPYCKGNISTAAKFTIPANAFKAGRRYDFRLKVEADNNPTNINRQLQMVHVVSYDTLDVWIDCLANCGQDKYNPRRNVRLKGNCHNCHNNDEITYDWYVDGYLMLSTRIFLMFIKNPANNVVIELKVSTKSGRRGSQQVSLERTRVPRNGNCVVRPTVGWEVDTKFSLCCANFTTKHLPIEYFSYAGDVLLKNCMDCKCSMRLQAHMTEIYILVCDGFFNCAEKSVSVNVKPMAGLVVRPPEALKELFSKLNYIMAKGRIAKFLQALQTAANALDKDDGKSAAVIVNFTRDWQPLGLTSLGRVCNLTLTLGLRLSPIDDMEHVVLVQAVNKINQAFAYVKNQEMTPSLILQPYLRVTKSCVTVYDMMSKLNKDMPRPPQHIFDQYRSALKSKFLHQPLINKLMHDIEKFDNAKAKASAKAWLNSMWETERLYRFLRIARDHGIESGDTVGIDSQGVALEIQCFEFKDDVTYSITTSDRLHTVRFTPELLKEMQHGDSKHICLKVISTVRELNWWYPEEKQPSIILLSVRIYYEKDEFTKEIPLHKSDISFSTVIGKYRPALEKKTSAGKQRDISPSTLRQATVDKPGKIDELDDEEEGDTVSDVGKYFNCLRATCFDYMQQRYMFRLTLDPTAMLVVRFKSTSHDLQVLLVAGEKPVALTKLFKHSCRVKAESTNTTLLLRNNCKSPTRAYIAVQLEGASKYTEAGHTPVENGPACFGFVFQVRSCDSWKYGSLGPDQVGWVSDYCVPTMEYVKNTMHCTCKALGTYTSYIYHVPAIKVPIPPYERVHINWVLLVWYITLMLLVLLWLIALHKWYNTLPSKTVTCDMTGLEDESVREVHDLLVYLKTGGRINAQTTATVRIIFQTVRSTELQFTLMQDPLHPQLTRNSCYVFWLRTRDIRLPTRIAVTHNNGGRYPSWFLRGIDLVDLQTQTTQVFVVQRWVRRKYLILSSTLLLKPGDERSVENWRHRFAISFERNWINWGFWHPVTGPWREGENYERWTRCERCCVFVTKIVVTWCVICCYFGPYTTQSIYEDRKEIVNMYDLMAIFIIAAWINNILQSLFEYVIKFNEIRFSC